MLIAIVLSINVVAGRPDGQRFALPGASLHFRISAPSRPFGCCCVRALAEASMRW